MKPVYTVKIKRFIGWKSYKVIRHRLAAKASDGGSMAPRLELTLENGENISVNIKGKQFRICSDFVKVKAYWDERAALEIAQQQRLQNNLLPGATDASRRPQTYPNPNLSSEQSVTQLRTGSTRSNSPSAAIYGANVRQKAQPTS